MKKSVKITLVSLGLIVWIAGFILVSLPAIDKWCECWRAKRIEGELGFSLHCYVGRGWGSKCDGTSCLEVDSPAINISALELGASLIVPVVPLLIAVVLSCVNKTKKKS